MSSHSIESFLATNQDINRLYHWIFEIVQPYIVGRVFETHSGNGKLSSLLIDDGFKVQLNATSEANREWLRQKFKDVPLVRGVHKIDFSHPELEEQYRHFENKFSTVLACGDFKTNFHYDTQALNKAKRLLMDGGRLIIVSQCPTIFFPGVDQDVEQLKRYTRDWIANVLRNCSILKIRLFDCNGTCFVSIAETN